MPTENKKQKSEASLEDSLARLEEIANALEGDLPLDRALELYEEGVRLIKESEKKISAAEKKIRTVTGKLLPEDEDEN